MENSLKDRLKKQIHSNFQKGAISQVTFLSAMETLDKIVKGGEGSRGGKIIGHTKSGKPIYGISSHKEASHEDYSNWSKQDHEDAADFHHSKYRSYQREAANSKFGSKSAIRSSEHQRLMGDHADIAYGKSSDIGDFRTINGESYKKVGDGKWRKQSSKSS